MVDKKQNKSYNVILNYNLTKQTQHTQISAMTAYKIASVAIVTNVEMQKHVQTPIARRPTITLSLPIICHCHR